MVPCACCAVCALLVSPLEKHPTQSSNKAFDNDSSDFAKKAKEENRKPNKDNFHNKSTVDVGGEGEEVSKSVLDAEAMGEVVGGTDQAVSSSRFQKSNSGAGVGGEGSLFSDAVEEGGGGDREGSSPVPGDQEGDDVGDQEGDDVGGEGSLERHLPEV